MSDAVKHDNAAVWSGAPFKLSGISPTIIFGAVTAALANWSTSGT